MGIHPEFESTPGKVVIDNEKQKLFWSEYWYIYDRLKKLLDYNKALAAKRFLLIKGFEEYFVKKEAEIRGSTFRRKKAMKKYCDLNNITLSSFYRWLRFYKQKGIDGIIPRYGRHLGDEGVISNRKKRPKKRSDKFITIEIEIDYKSPLSFLKKVKEIVRSRVEMQPEQQRSYIKLLNTFQGFSKRKYHTPLNLSLNEKEVDQLKKYRKRMHRSHHAKAIALLMISRGYSICEAALEANRSCNTIYRWLRLYRKKGISFIETRMTSDRKELMWKERTTRVIDILHAPPNTYDINRTSWTYDTITQAYYKVYKDHLPKGALKRIIKETKYTWQHARKVLTSNDPDYKKKIAKILSTLRNINKDEAFFFVDELGPYKVKAYGGKSLTPKGLTKTVPQYPQIKGEVQVIAALEAFSNQLTWEFTENKNSETIIRILEKLCQKYGGKTKLYITWDGISSHRSTHVREWVRDNNNKIENTGSGPTIEIAPLPSNAQFLNVIESVFGGMKKAVIRNSDYASKNKMQAAMDRHFAERNLFYEKNPKRAGNKIWDKQAFEIEELPGGLFKKM